MALEKQILEQLNAITVWRNELIANAKRTEEFPEMTELEVNSKIRVSFENESYWLDLNTIIGFLEGVLGSPIPKTYNNVSELISNQSEQIKNYIYEVIDGSGFEDTTGRIWVKYLSTFIGDESDYIIISRENVATKEVHSESFTYTSPNNTFTVINPINQIIDIQIDNGCNYDSYATVDNDNEVTIDNSIIYGGEKIKIIYK